MSRTQLFASGHHHLASGCYQVIRKEIPDENGEPALFIHRKKKKKRNIRRYK